jgi:uncharacterized protein YjcR
LIVSTAERTKLWYGERNATSATLSSHSASSDEKIDPQAFLEQATTIPTPTLKPQIQQQIESSSNGKSSKQLMRDQLRNMIDPGADPADLSSGLEEASIVDEHGKVKTVKINFNGQ